MFRRFLKRQSRKPLSRQVNGLFEELEPRVLYSAGPLGPAAESLDQGVAIHEVPVSPDNLAAESGAHAAYAASGKALEPGRAGFEQVRATLDGIVLWPVGEDSPGSQDVEPGSPSAGLLPVTDRRDEGIPENVNALYPGGDSRVRVHGDAAPDWFQGETSIPILLETGPENRESFLSWTQESEDVENTGIGMPVMTDLPVVKVTEENESFSIYHEMQPREVFESIDFDLPATQGVDELSGVPPAHRMVFDF